MEWLGLEPNRRTWEDINNVTWIAPSSNLEDKNGPDGAGDVTVDLDLAEVSARLKEELGLEEDDELDNVASPIP